MILDLGLPRLDGIEVAKKLRETDDVPILVLTARDARRVPRRGAGRRRRRLPGQAVRAPGVAGPAAGAAASPPPARSGDADRRRPQAQPRHPRGRPAAAGRIDLTQREFELLEYLMRNERIVISRQRLLDEVWGYDPFSMTNTIEVFVSNLRRKLEAGGEPRLLHTIRGAGYVLRV